MVGTYLYIFCDRFRHLMIIEFINKVKSDSEFDFEDIAAAAPVPVPPTKTPRTPKPSASKRKIAPVANAAALAHRPELPGPTPPDSHDEELQWLKKRKTDIFSIIKGEERASTSTAESVGGNVTTSSFTSRVSGGQSRRTVAVHEGDFYVEVKLYNVGDVQNTPPAERYKKALTSVKLRLNENCREWESLQEFLITAFKRFKSSNPVKFSNTFK